MVGDPTQDYYLSQPTSSPPPLLNSTALWYPQWTKYLHTSTLPHLLTSTPPHLHTSSPPHLHTSTPPHLLTSSPPHLHTSTPPHLLTSSPLHLLTSTPPHLLTSTPPHLLTSTALWYPQWTKYLLLSSTPPLSGAPSGPHPALWRPKWCSLAPQLALSGASRGNLHCSLAPSNGRSPKFLLYTTNGIIKSCCFGSKTLSLFIFIIKILYTSGVRSGHASHALHDQIFRNCMANCGMR